MPESVPPSMDSNPEPYDLERHDGDEPPICAAAGWCCGCDEHPVGKPWGWNSEAWDRHLEAEH